MKVDTGEFRQRFGAAWRVNYGWKLLFQNLGIVSGKEIMRVTEKGMYPVS